MRTLRAALAGAMLAALSGAMLAALAGCTVGPDFHRPDDDAPGTWWGGAPHLAAADRVGSLPTFGGSVDAAWWTRFQDPELTALVGRLARQNLDLQAAAERVEQGRAQRRIAASQGLPTLDANGVYDRVRTSPPVIKALFVPAPGAPIQYDLFQPDLSSAWEVDLFGRVRRAVEVQRADTEAAIEARHAIALMAISDLAQDYMQLRGTQATRAITMESLVDAERNVALVRNQFANGTGTTLDIANAEAQRATIASNLPPLRVMAASLVNAIGDLLAEPPRALQSELDPAELDPAAQPPIQPPIQPPVPPTVPIGLPAELARRRPDVREAEARLHAATAETGIAVADFYPDIRLSGQIGTQALQFPQAFNLYSGYFLVGPTIDLPIFEGGRLRATLRLRRSQQREAAISYRSTVLQAWRDVDDALTTYAEAQRRRDSIAEAVRQSTLALDAARQRYRQGAVDFLNVLTAQSALLQNRSTLAGSDTQIETDLVTLYRALGGGWEIADRIEKGQGLRP